jgi:GH35 family endo-1,4-beta-xylanase
MGLMRFAVTPPERITEEVVQQAYLSGVDQVPWEARIKAENGHLLLQRAASDSGNLHVPWAIKGGEPLVLRTASLIEQPQPYQLPLELARGVIAQLRNQLAGWQAIGVTVPGPVAAKVSEAIDRFSRAAVGQEQPAEAAAAAEAAIRAALEAGDLLAAAYVEQAMAFRQSLGGKHIALAGDLGGTLLNDAMARQFLATFSAASVPVCWRSIEAAEGHFNWAVCDRQIQWCRTHGLKILGGPLVQLDPQRLPDWLCLWEGDFDSLLSFASQFIRTVVSRYRGMVDAWQVAGRINSADVLRLTEEERLDLTARAVDLVHSLDPQAAMIVSFDQPWGEYLSRRSMDFPPLHLADALIRSGLDLKALMLEMNVGYWPDGTLPRPPLEFSRQLDCWATLGLPLMLSFTVPSSSQPDPLAARQVKTLPNNWTPQDQQSWVARYLPMLLTKPYVQAAVWNQLSDAEPHDFPHGGLFDRQRRPKPAIKALELIRQK